MRILVSLLAIDKGPVQLTGELPPEGLGLETLDPCVRAVHPVVYDLRIERMGDELLVQGSLRTVLDCDCVRCLGSFEQPLVLDPWAALLPLKGEEAVPVVSEMVDLTPQVREDILLALPQHPVCGPQCHGVPVQRPEGGETKKEEDRSRPVPSAWSVLDRLKLD